MQLGELYVKARYSGAELQQGLAQSQAQVNSLVQKLGGQNAQSLLVGSNQANAALAKVGKTAQQQGSIFAGLGGQLTMLVGAYASVQGAIQAAHFAWSAMSDFISEDTSINRVIAAVEAAGLKTDGLHDSLDKLGIKFQLVGQRQDAAYSGYRRLIQATGDAEEAQGLLEDALAFATRQGIDAETVISAVTKAYGGQARQLKMLLLDYMGTGKEAKNFAEAMELVRQGGQDADKTLGKHALTLNEVKTDWNEAKESMGRFFADAFTGYWKFIKSTGIDPSKSLFQNLFGRGKSQSEVGIDFAGQVTEVGTTAAKTEEQKRKELEQRMAEWRNRLFKDDVVNTQKAADQREAIERTLTDKLMRLRLSEFEYRKWVLDQELDVFRKAKLDEITLAEYQSRALTAIDADRTAAQERQFEDLAKKRKAAEEQMKSDWEESHRQQLEWTERFGDGFASAIADMTANGKASLQNFADFFRQIVQDMLRDLLSSKLKDWLKDLMHLNYGGGGNPPGYVPSEGEAPGTNIGSWRGGRGGGFGGPMPMPVPVVNVSAAPVFYVTNRIRSDVSDVGCETVVTRGLNRMQRIGR